MTRSDEFLDGMPIVGWITQRELASILRIDPRHVRNLVDVGLPERRLRGRPRYPLGPAVAWFLSYRIRLVAGEVVEHLPLAVAIAASKARAAEEDSITSGELRVRPARNR